MKQQSLITPSLDKMATETVACAFLLLSIWMVECTEVPKLKMNDGREMPAIALGTYLGVDQYGLLRSENKQLRDAVLHALDVGYRHLDTAAIYGTEEEIGEALHMKIDSGEVRREDVFITTKLWNTQHRREQVPPALRESLKQLGLNYVDLYLMHWPIGLNEDFSQSDVHFLETWRGMEDVQRLGLAKSIGVSNFNKEQIEMLLKEGTVKPAALQIEVHPQIVQNELVDFAQSHGIVVMAYSPFGSLVLRYGEQQPGPRIDDPTLVEIAKKYGKTTPQIVLRWLVDRNIVPLPKSVNPTRIEDNINIFDFHLTEEERQKIGYFNQGRRYTIPSFWQSHPYYPFEKVRNPLRDPFRENSFLETN